MRQRNFFTCLEGGRTLSQKTPDIKTYAFTYPTIADLFDHLNVRDCLLDSDTDMDNFWDQGILEVLERSSMEFIDELTLSSPRSLHLATGIAAWRVSLMYEEAMAMVEDFHIEMKPMIDYIEQVRT